MKLVIPLHSLYWSIHSKYESKRGTAFAFIFGVNWLWPCGVSTLFGVFFHEIKCDRMTSFIEFMYMTLVLKKPLFSHHNLLILTWSLPLFKLTLLQPCWPYQAQERWHPHTARNWTLSNALIGQNDCSKLHLWSTGASRAALTIALHTSSWWQSQAVLLVKFALKGLAMKKLYHALGNCHKFVNVVL